MDAMSKIGAALLIVLLLPAVIAEWEGRRLPDIFHAALAAGGLVFAALTGGVTGFGVALLVGIGCLALLGALVAGTTVLWSMRPLTGGNIKLLAAGAIWLGVRGALLLILIVALLFLASAVILRARKGVGVRPDLSPLVAAALLGIFMLQSAALFSAI